MAILILRFGKHASKQGAIHYVASDDLRLMSNEYTN